MPNLVYHTPCEPDVLERVHKMREAFLLMGKNMHLEAIDDFDDKVNETAGEIPTTDSFKLGRDASHSIFER